MRTKRNFSAALVALALVGAVSLGLSATGGTAAIKDRQGAMEEIGDSMQALAAIAKKQTPFDAAVIQKNASTIAEQLEKAAGLFPAGSERGEIETWAKAEIWSDAQGFTKALDQARDAAIAMKGVSDEGAFAPALGQLGSSCKNCHQAYRRPKQ
jgi:cytochrome c556